MSSREKALHEDFGRTFSTDHGKRVLECLAETYGMRKTVFDTDPYRTAFNEGARNVILTILSMMDSPPDITQMRRDPYDSLREEP